jgi:hypothetical protein
VTSLVAAMNVTRGAVSKITKKLLTQALTEACQKDGIVFDVSNVKDREITENDIDMNKVKAGMFVAFYTGFIE